MAIDVCADEVLDLIDADAQVEKLGTGCQFTEGPVMEFNGWILGVQRHSRESDEKVDA